MRHLNLLSSITIILMFAGSPALGNPLQSEPPLSTQVEWDLSPNGLLTVGYDSDQNGKADFFTLRSLVNSYMSDQSPEAVAEIYVGYPIFVVDYGRTHYFYISSKEPLFYAVDVNEDGLWDAIYQDLLEDGVNGNERFSGSPSGMASKNIAPLTQEASVPLDAMK